MMYLGDKAVGLLVNSQAKVDRGVLTSQTKVDSGVLTIPSSTNDIVVEHHLADIPDFAYIFIKIEDSNKIPFGSCVSCAYGDAHIDNSAYKFSGQISFRYSFVYRNSTSGNFFNSAFYCEKPTNTNFHFMSGNKGWPALDTDGNPIKYCWVVGKFVMEVTPNG